MLYTAISMSHQGGTLFLQTEPLAPRTNYNTGLTGLIAVICMIIDHVGVIFFPTLTLLRVIGRIALPLFAWGIAIGAEHTRSMERYAFRLFIMMIISQPFYMLALMHPLSKLNIFAVLFLGLIAIWGIREKKLYLAVLALLLTHFVNMDYGLRGVLCVLLLYATRNNPLALAVCFSAYCVLWGDNSRVILTLLDGHIRIRLQMMAILALPILLWPSARRIKLPRALMYAMYPAHLGVLYAIKIIIE